MASAGYLLLAQAMSGGNVAAQNRFFQGLLTGIGFLGGGAIVKHSLNVHGTATAASIWNIAAVGAAVAYGLFEIALLLSLVSLAVLRWLKQIKDKVQEAPDGEIETAGCVLGFALRERCSTATRRRPRA